MAAGMATAAGVAAVEGEEAAGRVLETAAGVVGLAAEVAGLARVRAVGVAAVRAVGVAAMRAAGVVAARAAVVGARGRGAATLPLPAEDEARRRCSVGGGCRGGGCRGGAAALSVGDASGRRPKLATALPRASRPGPAAAQSCRI